ncbi:unnamed protein product [Diamesa hyperborea]
MNSLETDLHNYKSLYEEIAQEDNNYLQNNTISNPKYGDEQCCCCNVHRRENNLYNSTATATTTTATTTTTTMTSRKSFSSYNYYDKMPIYNSIWLGEMRNATDYIEYLNKTRRNSNYTNNNNGNSSHQPNKDRSNYYKLSTSDYNSLNHDNDMNNNCNSSNFLQVPKLTMDEELRRTPEFDDIYRKISEINQLDNSVSALIYKSIEVHADILSLDATVSRLLAETRELLEEMEDVRCLDQIIEMLNSESVFHPIIHHEWKYHITNANDYPVEEGIPVA